MDMIQDWMIINKIKMGDPDAWDILVHKYYDSVYFYCVRRCYGDCDIASDLTQDIFLKLVESLPRYRFIGKFQNYLYTMAVNTCNNYLKKRHIEQIELTDNFTTDLDTSLIDEILHDERKETVQKALDLLPEIQREVVILRYYHDLKVKDIATITGVGVSTVQSRIYQGLRKLEMSTHSKSMVIVILLSLMTKSIVSLPLYQILVYVLVPYNIVCIILFSLITIWRKQLHNYFLWCISGSICVAVILIANIFKIYEIRMLYWGIAYFITTTILGIILYSQTKIIKWEVASVWN